MSSHDRKTGNVMRCPSGETTPRDLGFRHLLETDRMRLPDDPVEALEQLLREMGWVVQMIKAGGKAK
jgi:hypothetical protein